MKTFFNIRGGLLLTSACTVLAACSGGGDVENAGAVAPVIINPSEPGQGGSSADGRVDFTSVACPAAAPEGTITTDGGVQITACVIPGGNLTADLTLVAGNAYAIDGTVFVGEDIVANPTSTPVTLTIQPGVVLFGANGEDALVVTRGSQIDARGSQTQPIIMTSASDLADADQVSGDLSARAAASDGLVDGSQDARGEWGGLVINGRAPINACRDATATPGTAGCEKIGEGGSGLFGGGDADDDSGSLSYVRVQYAGFEFTGEDELNGIAFQGVGRGTEVDHIHVHNNNDDGIEFFGGTVEVDYVVVTGAGDDSFDWTDGWQGAAQHVVLVQGPGRTSDPRVIEADNREGNADLEPRSNPVISNLTILDKTAQADPEDGIKLRRGTNATIMNAIVRGNGFGDGIDFDGDSAAVTPSFFSTYVAGFANAVDDAGRSSLFDATGANNVRGGAPALTASDSVYSIADTQAVAATAPTDARIEATSYIGAFADNVQSLGFSWLANWTLPVAEFTGTGQVPTASCPTGTTQVGTRADVLALGRSENGICRLPNEILADTFLSSGFLYELDGTVFVGADLGPDAAAPLSTGTAARLTIDAGVTLYGVNGEDALVVTRGSQIFANGTRANPIVMTSVNDINDPGRDVLDLTTRGEWGGLVINGRAPINACRTVTATPGTAACEKIGEGGSGLFGGGNSTDNSGRLNYVRVQYAGFEFTGEDELNGIAFQGVGSGTEVDYVQVHNNNDDGMEFFGGTVNVKHAVITGAGDDSFDWTDGWQGKAQFVVLQQEPGRSSDPRVIEADNREGNADLQPRSNPTIANLTLIDNTSSADPEAGIKLRRGTNATFYNAIVVGNDFGDGIDFDADTVNATPTFFSTYVVDFANPLALDGATSMFTTANGNVNGDAAGQDSTLGLAPNARIALVPGANETAPNITPTALPADPFFDDAAYVGAVENASDDWYLGWTIALSN